MADQRNSDVLGQVQKIRDLAYTGQNNRRFALTQIEQIASKLVTEITGDATATRTPSPVVPRKQPAPAPVATASVTATGAPSADDLKAAQKADEEQRKAADATHNQQLAEMQTAGAPIFAKADEPAADDGTKKRRTASKRKK